MKITNEGSDAREYPTLGVILQAGESYDDAKAKVVPASTVYSTPSAASDSTVEEVK
jgi:hypothetical protein